MGIPLQSLSFRSILGSVVLTNRIAIGAPAEIGRNTGSSFARIDAGLTSVYFSTVAWGRLR
jgi:hypothetical protein